MLNICNVSFFMNFTETNIKLTVQHNINMKNFAYVTSFNI